MGETSDVVSANLSNDECSVGSEILDRHSESFSVNAGDVIQVIDNQLILENARLATKFDFFH